MNEEKQPTATDDLLKAMSREDIYSPQFIAFLDNHGVSPETLYRLSYAAMRFMANALTNTIEWPKDWLVTEEMVNAVSAQRTPAQVFDESELSEWALDNGFTDDDE